MIVLTFISCISKSKNELEVKQKQKDDCFIFLNNGEYYQAFRIADDQINIDSNDLEFYYIRGIANKFLTNYRAAISDLTHMITYDSLKAKPYYYRSECYFKIGEQDSSFWDNYKCQILDTSVKNMILCTDFLFANFTQDYIQNKWDQNRELKVQYSLNTKGERDGKYSKKFKNGALCEKGNYKNGKLNGIVTMYYENGQKKSETSYSGDSLNGISREWFANGKLMSEISYKNGTFDGINATWYEDGRIRTKGNYINGKLNGDVLVWNEKLKLYYIEVYKDDKMVAKKRL